MDEINRTPPRTQAALLEAMEERQVTIDGVRYPLSENFTVLATQNPIEFEGTYPLPEAQLDRFLLKIRIVYPSGEEEIEILSRYDKGFDPRRLEDIALDPLAEGALAAARREIETVKIEPSLYPYIVNLVRRTRDWPAISLGASPRRGHRLVVRRARDGRHGRPRLRVAGRHQERGSSGFEAPDLAQAGSRPRRSHLGSGDRASRRVR